MTWGWGDNFFRKSYHSSKPYFENIYRDLAEKLRKIWNLGPASYLASAHKDSSEGASANKKKLPMDEGEKEYQLPVSVKDQKVLIWCLLRGWQKYVQLELWPVSSAIIPQQNAEFYKCTFHISDENIKMMHTELDTMLELFKQQRPQVKGEDCPVWAHWLAPRNMMPPASSS